MTDRAILKMFDEGLSIEMLSAYVIGDRDNGIKRKGEAMNYVRELLYRREIARKNIR